MPDTLVLLAEKLMYTVNGETYPTVEVVQGDILEVGPGTGLSSWRGQSTQAVVPRWG